MRERNGKGWKEMGKRERLRVCETEERGGV